tara:strand:+ start:267 stop:674 length:408 start_codon:yes stop_codon:yes gene_type:complete
LETKWIDTVCEDNTKNRWNLILTQEARIVKHNYMVYIGSYLIEEFIYYASTLFSLLRFNETVLMEDRFKRFRTVLIHKMFDVIQNIKSRDGVRPFQKEINEIETYCFKLQNKWSIDDLRDASNNIFDALEMAKSS